MGIGRRIKEARLALNMTQEELSKLLGVTKGSVANYENETSHPKEPIMYKMFDALRVDANYLFQDVVNVSTPKNDVTISEYKIIEKYRDLDDHGREMVDFTLQKEWERSAALAEENKVTRFSHYSEARAAHNDFADDEEQQKLMQEDLDEL